MRSSDGGTNWEQLTHGLPNPFESMVECIEFDPDQPDHVLIGTGGEGARFIKLTEGEIFHSRDRGDHWESVRISVCQSSTPWRSSDDGHWTSASRS